MLNAASNGRTAAFDANTSGCGGGSIGLGFKKFEPGSIEYFLSTGEVGGREGEFYNKTPQFAWEFVKSLPDIITPAQYVVFKPLEVVGEEEVPEYHRQSGKLKIIKGFRA